MTCPFEVGDRVYRVRAPGRFINGPTWLVEGETQWVRDDSYPDATVTSLTARGFTYRYDKPIQFVRASWGTTQEGEVYEEGFHFWRKVAQPSATLTIGHPPR